MTRTSSPTVLRRWLALEMRRLRLEAGLSQGDVARGIGCKVPKVSLIEGGERNIHDDDLLRMLELFEVPIERHSEYVEAARIARTKGWWERYDDHTTAPWHQTFVGLEQGAERLRSYQTAIFHGLLQTPAYTAAILRSGTSTISEEMIVRLVDLRRRRQEAIVRDDHPLQLWALVDEAALRHVIGGHETMRSQLEHVAEVVRDHDNVTFQIVPFERGAAWEATYGPFTILSFGFRTDPGVVYIEHRSGAMTLDSIAEVDTHSTIFERLRGFALTPEKSVKLLLQTAKDYTDG
jgi:transcriptional regulator with XRE-family HTH domain